jgi:hypothetical protein
MRKLTVRRQKALAAFALLYYGVLDQDAETFVSTLESQETTARFAHVGDFTLRNGERKTLDIDSREHTLFVVIYTENRNIVTNTVSIAPGDQDADFTVVTDYDGYRHLTFSLAET